MKRILAYLLVAVMAFSVIGMLNLAAPMKASADSGNLALNKPVTEELNECVAMGDPYWNIAYINDGERFDTTEYNAQGPVCNEYGWYVVKQDLEPMNASATIDLEGTYDVCRIKLYTEYHFLGSKFPNTYDVYVSADGSNWTRVCGEADRTGYMTHAREFEFDKISARYVKVTIVKGNDVVTDDGHDDQYAGIGEIEVYDTYNTSGNIGADKIAKATVDPSVTTWVLGNSGQWDIDAVTGSTVPYGFGPYNMTGWIAVSPTLEANMRVDVDLSGVYKINKINILPMPWSETGNDDAGWYMPNTYDVVISEDGSNWTTVYHGDNETTVGVKGKTKTIEFTESRARYVSLVVTKSTYRDYEGARDYWTGFGCIQVFGAYAVKETPPAPAGGLRDFDMNKGDLMYYDQILDNGVEVANGNDAVIAKKALIDGSDGSITAVAMHGWYGNDSAKIVSYGYIIDGGQPVFGDFTIDCEPEVIQAGGESRFTIVIDVTGLKDGKEHKIQAVAKMDNGDIVKLNRFEDGKDRDAYVNYKAQYVEQPHTDPVPQTGDATVALISIVAVISLAAAVIFRKRAF